MTFSFSFFLLTLALLILSPPSTPSPGWSCLSECVCGQGGQVNCSGGELHFVPRILDPRVQVLLLGHNHIDFLSPGAFALLPRLLSLELQSNGLQRVHVQAFWGLRVLQSLDLSANALQALEPGTFRPLRALHTLSLAGNRLMRLEPMWLGPLPLLQNLNLQDNLLSSMGSGVLDRLPALHELNLHGNPWICDCTILSLCRWLRSHAHQILGAESLMCVSPDQQILKPLAALTEASFNYCTLPLTPWDLGIITMLGPLSFLASLAACFIFGSLLTAFRVRRKNRHYPVKRPIPQTVALGDPPENPTTNFPAPACFL
ncbi:leucine-rich repeat-containing protein 26-like isoform X1 [Antechinus flavipes]|uniref:leucine-rich repeat-containing protein 26-like isoform X1 n=1 Tax=Antechinus flavipes TaxID=38775 RepID=UPI002236ACC4|nr:leucine-rich repeat-containing protein 26-like isoform X1 [Antechinus flavipes]XP_051832838.1 leucine-rich repeat-containing protein 26-like isoform X1 [Antechinus flavipes]XP_051832839.1 leucine-rich repeat-containing protein 26-like isoform X1 [Antechinus flavipes]XP_051832840.1 leucine-rich repeat-containing protein 26-like isoform X1 [Antechinus flavipes]